jgi:hypothetical protein
LDRKEKQMSMLRRIFAGFVVALAPVATADAAVLFTPYINAGSGQDLICSAVNVGKKPLEIAVELFAAGGFPDSPLASASSTAAPGSSPSALLTGPTATFCRITVKGPKNKVRGQIRVRESGGGTVAIVPAQ